MKYRIVWRSKLTGFRGHSEWETQENAEAWLKMAQHDYPDIEHWLEVSEE